MYILCETVCNIFGHLIYYFTVYRYGGCIKRRSCSVTICPWVHCYNLSRCFVGRWNKQTNLQKGKKKYTFLEFGACVQSDLIIMNIQRLYLRRFGLKSIFWTFSVSSLYRTVWRFHLEYFQNSLTLFRVLVKEGKYLRLLLFSNSHPVFKKDSEREYFSKKKKTDMHCTIT